MKTIYQFFLQFIMSFSKSDVVVSNERNFFDYSAREKIKIMRAAGRQAQKKQQELLDAYGARFERNT